MSLRYTEPRMAFESSGQPPLLVSDRRKGCNAYLVSVPLSPLPPRLVLHSASQRAVGSAVLIQEPTSQRRGSGSRQREQASPGRTSGQRTSGHASGQVQGGMAQAAARASLGMDRERCWDGGARSFLCGSVLALLEPDVAPLQTGHGAVGLMVRRPVER